MTIEATVAVAAGLAAGSVALMAFGLGAEGLEDNEGGHEFDYGVEVSSLLRVTLTLIGRVRGLAGRLVAVALEKVTIPPARPSIGEKPRVEL